ncbi:AtpZ/AtpI family protein [soil metagenome]
MAESDRKPTPDDLDRRLKGVRQEYQAGTGRSSKAATGSAGGEKIGVGMRIAVEMVAGVVAGAFMGLMADQWLGTKPWLLIVGFVLGCCAAFLNVYRVAQAEERRSKAASQDEKKS